MAPLTTVIICVSERELADGLAAGTCKADRAVVIRNAVDVAAAPRSRHERATPRLIAVGRLKAPKDFLTLVLRLRCSTAGSYEALIVGDGPDRAAIEAEIERLGLEDSRPTGGERADVPELLADSDVFVLSSVRRACRSRCWRRWRRSCPSLRRVSADWPSSSSTERPGILVPSGDHEALAAALARTGRGPRAPAQVRGAGRSRAEALFDLAAFRRAHVDLYDEQLALTRRCTEVAAVEGAERR